MSIERRGGNCAKVTLIIYTLLFWVSGLALIFIGLWMLLDPKRNYVLDLVNFSEDDPLLTFASYIAIVAGILTLFVGFVGFCGALKRMRCLLVGFILCLFTLFLADVAIGTLALVYRNKMNSVNSTLEEDLRNIVKFSYGVSLEVERNRKLTTIIDKLQFYEECCGVSSAHDFRGSRWMAALSPDPFFDNSVPPVVPLSCCTQLVGASALNPEAKSLARCQQPAPTKQWRHTVASRMFSDSMAILSSSELYLPTAYY